MRPLLLVCAAALLAACGGDSPPTYNQANPHLAPAITTAPRNTGDGWSTSTPAAEGMDETELQLALTSIRDGSYPGVDALLVARHGRLVAEGYYNGFGPDTPHDIRSASKSFVSALAGIAIDQGLFGVDDPVSQLIPGFEQHANMSAEKEAITVRNLLDMNSGLDCNDWNGDLSPGHEEAMYASKDWIGFVLDLRMPNPPGTVPAYCTGGVVLLSHVIAVRSGRGLDDFANTWLFGPLGIHDVIWRRSPDGQAAGGASGTQVKPRDAAKLGQLYLDGGRWNGQQVEPAAWVAESQRRAVSLGGDGYGFLWWKRSFPGPNGAVECFFANGNGGNYVFVIPALDLVVTFTGSNYNSERSSTPYYILANDVLTAVTTP